MKTLKHCALKKKKDIRNAIAFTLVITELKVVIMEHNTVFLGYLQILFDCEDKNLL